MHLFRLDDHLSHQCLLNETELADNFRVITVGFVGSFVAALSVIQNAIIFYIFSTSRKLRRQNYANPLLLATFDTIVSICYILSASVQVIAYHYQLETIVKAWATYVRIAYCMHHFALTVSNFILVIASTERFLANGSNYCEKRLLVFMVKNKVFVMAIIIFLSILFKGTLYFETSLLILEHCPSIESIIPIWIRSSDDEWQATRFWIRKIFTIILPFLVLAACNLHIVMHLKKRKRKFDQIVTQSQRIATAAAANGVFRRSAKHSNKTTSFRNRYSEKKGVRVATRTLAMVVGCYLISNTTTTIINIWEYLDPFFFRYQHYYGYLVASDLAALLTIFGCALRLPIYMFNDHRIRKALFRAILRLRYKRSEKLHEFLPNNFEKWSIVIVSNSLRSNLTGMLSQDWKTKKSIDQLGMIVQNRRSFLVQMTINLGKEMGAPQKQLKHGNNRRDESTTMGNDITCLTDIQEEEHSELLLSEHRTSFSYQPDYQSITPSKQQHHQKWHAWKAQV